MEILRKTRGISVYYEIPLKKRYYRGEPREESGGGACYIVEMLQNNHLSFLLPVRLQWMDMALSLLFKADGYYSLAALFGRKEPGWEDVAGLLRDLSACIRELQDHLLPSEGIVLSAAYIIWDENLRHYRFLYTPEPECSFACGMKKLLEEIMPLFAHGNKEEVVRFYDLYGKFLDERFTPGMLLSLTDRLDIQTGRRTGVRNMNEQDTALRLPVLWNPGRGIEGSYSGCDIVSGGEGSMSEEMSGPGNDFREPHFKYGLSGKTDPSEQHTGAVMPGARRIIPYLVVGILFVGLLLTALFLKNSAMTKIVGLVGLVVALGYLFFRRVKGDNDGEVKETVSGNRELLRQPDWQNANGERVWKEQVASAGYGTGMAYGGGPAAEPKEKDGQGFVGVTRLIPADTTLMQPITVTEGTVRIGRSEEENEYCIPVPGISRVHANLLCRNGNVYLEDLDSTNGTYVNQVRISSKKGAELHYGDVVSFAGEEYYCV